MAAQRFRRAARGVASAPPEPRPVAATAAPALLPIRQLSYETPTTPALTERETEVLRFVAKGLSAKQIAEKLSLSHRTVENHVQATFRKLQVANRVEATRYAIEHGLHEE